jgi:hypothetical protein
MAHECDFIRRARRVKDGPSPELDWKPAQKKPRTQGSSPILLDAHATFEIVLRLGDNNQLKQILCMTFTNKTKLLAAILLSGISLALIGCAQTVQSPKFQLINGAFNSWAAAKADAESRGGHLAAFPTLQTWEQFTNFVSLTAISSNQWWLGATDIQQRGTYAWITGDPWSFTNWASGEPSGTGVNGIEDYLAMNPDGTWNDAAATIQISIGYVLEYEPQN